jgi:hypothetical protein
MRRTLFTIAVPLLALLTVGCDPDCDNPSRLDGRHSVWSNVVEHTPVVTAIPSEYPVYDIFYNGHSEWRLRYVQNQRAFDLVLDDQAYQAAFLQDPDNCNAFSLSFEGVYVSPGGTQHDFSWQGDLVYFGSHMGGTFEYVSDWADVGTSTAGHVWTVGELHSSTTEGDTGY